MISAVDYSTHLKSLLNTFLSFNSRLLLIYSSLDNISAGKHHKTLSCNCFGVHVSLVHILTLLQLLFAASYGVWCRRMTLTKTGTEQTCGERIKMGGSIFNITYEDRRTHKPPQRRSMYLTCHHLEITQLKRRQTVNRRPGHKLEGRDLAEDHARQGQFVGRLCVW